MHLEQRPAFSMLLLWVIHFDILKFVIGRRSSQSLVYTPLPILAAWGLLKSNQVLSVCRNFMGGNFLKHACHLANGSKHADFVHTILALEMRWHEHIPFTSCLALLDL